LHVKKSVNSMEPEFVITVLSRRRHWTLHWARIYYFYSYNPLIYTYVCQDVSYLQVFRPKFIWISLLFQACSMFGPSHPFLLYQPHNIWWTIQIMKLLVRQLSLPRPTR
jgi:hypothetical protein